MSIMVNPYMSGVMANDNTRSIELSNKLKINKSSEEELLKACEDFEAYMIEQVFKEMKKTVNSEEESNDYMKYFSDILYKEYATNTVQKQELGIAKMLFDSMKNNNIIE